MDRAQKTLLGREGRGAAPPQGEHGRRGYCKAAPPGWVTILVPPMRLRRRWPDTTDQREPEQQLRGAEDQTTSTQ
ncbi:hypothetical protein NDU88_008604 [Pleurodeles waltl]|uniref:Uncharacterized protein n=1 Tax=Pleurodeles waltl TaxID=8319 RepID=A0AAV7RSV6_PLEWA|nr:hypothetical protein NDU88_008604 [Pleurodeles waltl]